MNISYTQLDRLFSTWIRRRDGKCQYCGKSGIRLEAAHMFGRGMKSVRFDPENVYAMCGGPSDKTCHHWLDMHNTEKMDWLRKRLGNDRYNALLLRANAPKKPDLALIRMWLKVELGK